LIHFPPDFTAYHGFVLPNDPGYIRLSMSLLTHFTNNANQELKTVKKS